MLGSDHGVTKALTKASITMAKVDVWSFRQAWAQEKDKLKEALAAGRFRFGLLTRITLKDGEEIDTLVGPRRPDAHDP